MTAIRKRARQFAPDALALAALEVVAWLVAGFLLRDDVFIWHCKFVIVRGLDYNVLWRVGPRALVNGKVVR
jgi:hypothetical protein